MTKGGTNLMRRPLFKCSHLCFLTWAIAIFLAQMSCCSADDPAHGPKGTTWVYFGDIRSFNLLGFPDNLGDGDWPFALPELEVLRKTDSILVVGVHSGGAETTLLLVAEFPPGALTSKTPADGKVRKAWLVRAEPDSFATPYKMNDSLLLRVVDREESDVDRASAFAMEGTASMTVERGVITHLNVDLRTSAAVPLFESYKNYILCNFEEFPTLSAELSAVRIELDSPRSTYASLKGAICGHWHRLWRPPI